MALRAGGGEVVQVHLVERAGLAVPDPGWEINLRAESDGSVGDGRAVRDAAQVAGVAIRTGEVHNVAGLGDGDIDGEDGRVGHAVEAEDAAVEVGDGDH